MADMMFPNMLIAVPPICEKPRILLRLRVSAPPEAPTR
jgi:hypothetical protein